MGRHYYERIIEVDWGLGTVSVDLFDLTSTGVALETFRPDSYRVISSALPGYQVAEPEWLEFKGRWGQYENLADEFNIPGCGFEIPIPIYTYKDVGNGPTGPAMKTPWTDGDCLQIW
jgi:hypothetical protein